MLPSILALLGNIYHSDLPEARASTQQQQQHKPPAQPRPLYQKSCTSEIRVAYCHGQFDDYRAYFLLSRLFLCMFNTF